MEVGDELAGQTGQCPRCQHVFTIPSPKQPMPTLVGKAVPSAPTRIPPADPWAQDVPREEDKPRSGAGRPRRVRAAPKQPSGPIWPWFVGILGALVVGGLLFSSFLVLALWRKSVTKIAHVGMMPPPQVGFDIPPPLQVMVNNQRVTVGVLDGQRAFMQNGVFQVKTELNNIDPIDNRGCRTKRFEIELLRDRTYVFEQDSNQFDSLVRIETFNVFVDENGFRFNRNARVMYTPLETQVYTIIATSVDPAFGAFTLTVREQGMPKPFVP